MTILGRRHTDGLFLLLVILVASWLASLVFIHNPADRPSGLAEASVACFTAWLSEKQRVVSKERKLVADSARHAEQKTEEHEARIENLEDATGISPPGQNEEPPK